MNAMTASRASLSTRNGRPDAAIASRTRRTTSPTSTCSVPGSVGSCSVSPGTVNPNSSRSFSMRLWFSVTAPDSSNAIRNGMTTPLTCTGASSSGALRSRSPSCQSSRPSVT